MQNFHHHFLSPKSKFVTPRIGLFILAALLFFSARITAQTQIVRFDTAILGQTFTVPQGVTEIKVKAWGAAGGAYCCGTPSANIGGGGGLVSTTLTVTPGEVLTINVGGGGNTAGGLNGGGPCTGGAGGGGSTDLLRGNTYLFVAGGGGGAGNGTGGPGGGLTGGATSDCNVASQGGSQTTGGLKEDCNQGSSDGTFHQGGYGHQGGGGGGYYGGGGGSCGCGGGGGSSYIISTGTTCTNNIQAPAFADYYTFIGGMPADSVDIDLIGTTAGHGHISTGSIASGNGSPGLMVIKYNYPSIDVPRIVGYDTMCPGVVTTYKTDALMANYVWAVTGGATIVSHGTSTDPTIEIRWSAPGTVSVKYTDCSVNSTITTKNVITSRPALTIAANPPGSVCAGTPVTFMATSSNVDNNPAYQWLQNSSHVGTDSGATFTTAALNNNDTITGLVVSVVSGSFCTSPVSNSIIIQIGASGGHTSNITASPDSLCGSGSSQLSVTGSNGTFQWQSSTDGTTFSNISNTNNLAYTTPSISQTTSYRFIAVSGNCSDTSATFKLKVNPLPASPVITTTDSVRCAPDSALIQSSGTYAVFNWSNGDIRNFTYAVVTGVYSLTVTNASNCSAVSNNKNITLNQPPATPTISRHDSIICASDSAFIQTLNSYHSYTWNTGDTTNYTYANIAGDYWLTVTDVNNCTAVSAHQQIAVYAPVQVSITRKADTLSSFGARSYQWLLNGTPVTNATDSIFVASQQGSYTVQVTDTNGCIATSSPVTITGINDLPETSVSLFPNPSASSWQLSVENNLLGSKLEMFDAAGQLVFQSEIKSLKSEINLDLPNGFYWLRIYSADKIIARKLIKL